MSLGLKDDPVVFHEGFMNRTIRSWFFALIVGACQVVWTGLGDTTADAQRVLQQYCADCHGRDAKKPRKINKKAYLDVKTTLAELGDANVIEQDGRSEILDRLHASDAEERMPQPNGDTPAATVTSKDEATLRQWFREISKTVAGRATDVPRRPQNPYTRSKLVEKIHADLKAMPKADRGYVRYLSLHNLANAGLGARLPEFRAGVGFAVNSLSSTPKIAKPTTLGRVLLRIDLRRYGWGPNQWERLVECYPYDITPNSALKKESEVRRWLGSEVPFLRADWFVFAALQPPLYHELLSLPGDPTGGLPASDTQLESKLKIAVLPNLKSGNALRAAFTESGVSDWNRLIERHTIDRGYYWKSYDFGNDGGAGDLIQHPLGPVGLTASAQPFHHAGGETIWTLPNGLQGYLLYTSTGKRLSSGPTGIVRDPQGPQQRIMNGISCIRCHFAGMRTPKGGGRDIEESRQKAGAPLPDSARQLFDELYRPATDVLDRLDQDGKRFKEVALQTGITDQMFSEVEQPVYKLYDLFRSNIQKETIATELDMDPIEFDTRLKQLDGADNASVNSLIKRLPKGIKRQNFIQDFRTLVDVFVSKARLREFKNVAFEEFIETPPTEATEVSRPAENDLAPAGMVKIPPGTFTMGSPASEANRGSDEVPHLVEISKEFYIGQHEVTQAEYEQVMGTNTSHFKGGNLPMENVSWVEANEYCTRLTARERTAGRLRLGHEYRLPTEAQWEYACRAGTTTATAFGRSLSSVQANFNGENPYQNGSKGPALRKTTPVGKYGTNAFGLYDMHGNVWEWCADYFGKYPKGSLKDPTGPEKGELRVNRGGGWDSLGENCRSARRDGNRPNDRLNDLGFRVVLVRVK